jgi:hypothetical protein
METDPQQAKQLSISSQFFKTVLERTMDVSVCINLSYDSHSITMHCSYFALLPTFQGEDKQIIGQPLF